MLKNLKHAGWYMKYQLKYGAKCLFLCKLK